MKENITFNLNDNILVKIKDEGFKYWVNDLNKWLPATHQATEMELRERADNEGYVRFQMWEFMSLFGPVISLGNPVTMFETNIKVEVQIENKGA